MSYEKNIGESMTYAFGFLDEEVYKDKLEREDADVDDVVFPANAAKDQA